MFEQDQLENDGNQLKPERAKYFRTKSYTALMRVAAIA